MTLGSSRVLPRYRRWPCPVVASLVVWAGTAFGHGAPDTGHTPESRMAATITGIPEIPGLSVMVLEAPRPGLLLSYRGERALTILGEDREPMLRFTGTGVEANLTSPTFMSSTGRNDAQETQDGPWSPVSGSGTYGWMDPRLAVSANHTERWEVKITDGSGNQFELRGTLEPVEFQ